MFIDGGYIMSGGTIKELFLERQGGTLVSIPMWEWGRKYLKQGKEEDIIPRGED